MLFSSSQIIIDFEWIVKSQINSLTRNIKVVNMFDGGNLPLIFFVNGKKVNIVLIAYFEVDNWLISPYLKLV